MGTTIVVSAVCVLLFLLYLASKIVGLRKFFEKMAVFWFRFACSFVLLYMTHIIVDDFGIIVPVNFFSALTITILGIPGTLCIIVLTFFQ